MKPQPDFPSPSEALPVHGDGVAMPIPRRAWGGMATAGLRAVALLAVPALAFIWLAGEAWAGFQQRLAQVSPWAAALLLVWNVLALLAISSRGWMALRAAGYHLPYLAVWRYRMAAFAISYLTPGQQFGGEPLLLAALTRRHGLPPQAALAAIAFDRLVDVLANFGFLLLGLALLLDSKRSLFSDLLPAFSASWVALAPLAIAFAVPVIYGLLLRAGRYPLQRWLPDEAAAQPPADPNAAHPVRLAAWLKRLRAALAAGEAQLGGMLRGPLRPLAAVWLAAGLIWLFLLSEYWLALAVFGARLDLAQTVMAMAVVRLAFLSPLPAGLGALEAGQILALQALGFGPEAGIAISLWIRLRDAGLAAIGLACGAHLLPVET